MANLINNKLECFMFYLLALSYVLSDRFVDEEGLALRNWLSKKEQSKPLRLYFLLSFLNFYLDLNFFFSYLYMYILILDLSKF